MDYLESNPLNKSIEDLINLDVLRSFPSSKIVTSKSLTHVLKVFAYANPKIMYCQGMNFIAGFLIMVTRDEETAFKFMQQLISHYEMQDFYIEDIVLLKKNLYLLDRFIANFYPNLDVIFRIQNINSSLYASSWLMTIFTRAMQLVQSGIPTAMTLKIWDCFLIDGWKAFFKAALFIINELKDNILDGRFDQIMELFSNVSRAKILHDSLTAKKFMKSYKNLDVSNFHIRSLKEEYDTVLKEVHNNVSGNK